MNALHLANEEIMKIKAKKNWGSFHRYLHVFMFSF